MVTLLPCSLNDLYKCFSQSCRGITFTHDNINGKVEFLFIQMKGNMTTEHNAQSHMDLILAEKEEKGMCCKEH